MLKFRVEAVAVVSAFVFLTPRQSATQEAGKLYFCQAEVGLSRGRLGAARPHALYITPIRPLAGIPFADINDAWLAYAAANIDKNARMQCVFSTESGIAAMHDNSQIGLKPGEIIDPKWEYKRSMTALPSKVGAVYAWCMSGNYVSGSAVYSTPVFEIPMEDARAGNYPVEVTFAAYLRKHYNLSRPPSGWQAGGVGCPHNYSNRNQAEEYRQAVAKEWRAKGVSVVETTWTYARNSDTPPLSRNSTLSH